MFFISFGVFSACSGHFCVILWYIKKERKTAIAIVISLANAKVNSIALLRIDQNESFYSRIPGESKRSEARVEFLLCERNRSRSFHWGYFSLYAIMNSWWKLKIGHTPCDVGGSEHWRISPISSFLFLILCFFENRS